ncbi:MAG: 3-hydroxyisobutyryl-CoA hydrolase, partial [Mycobacterium sp.]
MAENEDILVSVRNGVGIVTLNRPKAINSLNDVMVEGLQKALTTWENDDSVGAVLLTGAGERGLCAGGDVVALYHSAKADGAYARKFWWDEYLLNAYIGRYPKPYIALMDGIVMGGGVGVAAHADVRVVTDKTKMGMPEVGIGFIPDVGGTYLLSRTPGSLGLHAALTGAPFSGPDAIALGFADHFVPHEQIQDFAEAVVNDGHQDALNSYAQEPPPSDLLAQRDWIDTCYAGNTVADIVADLRRQETERADAAADLIATRSPIALAVTLTAVRRAAHLQSL